MEPTPTSTAPKLRRVLGFWALVAYGIGDILGAGIYALTGEIAALAGHLSWLAFAIALAIAALTAFSYAELSGRFPRSGGESTFCEEGFRSKRLAFFVGWLVVCSGVLSMATVSHAFAGYVLDSSGHQSLFGQRLLAAGFLVGIALINFRGMRLTSRFNIVSTIIEAAGLILVLVAGCVFLAESGSPVVTGETSIGMKAILQASVLAFFVFIGFEDMANVAEEVKDPSRNLPRAILTVVAVTGLFYMAVIWVAVHVVDSEVLAASDAPLLEVVRRAAPSVPPILFTAIALFAVGNTGLLNSVTTSRLLYGMSRQKLLPDWFGRIHPKRRTPHRTIVVILLISAVLSVTGSLGFLGGATSALILSVFLVVNLSLIAVRLREKGTASDARFRVPLILPVLASLFSVALITFASLESLLRAGLLALPGLVPLLFAKRWRSPEG